MKRFKLYNLSQTSFQPDQCMPENLLNVLNAYPPIQTTSSNWPTKSSKKDTALAANSPFKNIQTEGVLHGLAALKPETLAIMHGSSYIGPSDKLLPDLAGVIKKSFNSGN